MLFKGFKKNGISLMYGTGQFKGKAIKCMISKKAFKGVVKPINAMGGSL